MGSKNALAQVSSGQHRPWLFTIHRPWDDNRRDHTSKRPRFSPDSYTKLWDKLLFIWQQGGTVPWSSRRHVRALAAKLGRGMVEQQAWSFRAWVLHRLAGASISQPAPPRKQPGEVG